MKIYCRGTARIRHGQTGQTFAIEGGELDWNVVDRFVRDNAVQLHHQAVVHRAELGSISWDLWEYPEGIEVSRRATTGPHQLLVDLDYGLDLDRPHNDGWFDDVPPTDPFSIFMNSYHETTDLLADSGGADGAHLVNRLVFSHQITAMEAYLGDTLINEVFSDAEAMRRLMVQDNELNKPRFTLDEIYRVPDFVERKIREHLRGLMYHNLTKIDVIYGIALRIRLWDHAADKDSLTKAVLLRHDCVHRNGSDKDGSQLKVFTKAFVRETADAIRDFVTSIENAVRTRSKGA